MLYVALNMCGNDLHAAVVKGYVPVVKCLLKQYGANLLAVTTDNSTVLHLAATTCDAVMLDELLTMMRDSGCDVAELLAQRNSDGETALYSVDCTHGDIVMQDLQTVLH
jgi:DNA-binding NarL/FixJ family response regulator